MLHRLTHMLSCKEATRLLSQAQDRRLSYGERIKLRLHLMACVACSRFSRQLAVLREAVSRFRS
jgi:hypothetical protein